MGRPESNCTTKNAIDIFLTVKCRSKPATKNRVVERFPISLLFSAAERGTNSITSIQFRYLPARWTSFSISFTSLARKLVAFPFGTPAPTRENPIVECFRLLARNIEFHAEIHAEICRHPKRLRAFVTLFSRARQDVNPILVNLIFYEKKICSSSLFALWGSFSGCYVCYVLQKTLDLMCLVLYRASHSSQDGQLCFSSFTIFEKFFRNFSSAVSSFRRVDLAKQNFHLREICSLQKKKTT